jgi:hypothetical protein
VLKLVRRMHVNCKRAGQLIHNTVIDSCRRKDKCESLSHLVIGSACHACRSPPVQQWSPARRALPANLEHMQYNRLKCSSVPVRSLGLICSLFAGVAIAIYECCSR